MQPSLLLIEDDPLSQDLIRSLCESRSFTVDAAGDGFTGLKLLKDGGYALALVDYHLPEMDGYALARLMRDLPRQDSTPLGLVAITADRFGLAARRGSDTLFDAVLPKPLVPNELFALLDRFAGLTPLHRAAETLAQDPGLDAARALSEALWREEGLAGRPRALAFPVPTESERAALAHAFDVVDDGAAADLLLLLDAAGLQGLHAARVGGEGDVFIAPAIDVSGCCGAVCDAVFEVADRRSWSAVAATLRTFDERRTRLSATMRGSRDVDHRLLARLHVAGQPLSLRRQSTGARVPDVAAGFPDRDVLESANRLRRAGLLEAASPGEDSILVVTEDGVRLLEDAQPRRETEPVELRSEMILAETARSVRILLVERDAILRASVGGILAHLGCEVRAAASLIEAVAELGQGEIDLVLLGHAVPDLDAAAAATLLRTLRGPDAPALSLAALASAQPTEPAASAGLVAVVEPTEAALRGLVRGRCGADAPVGDVLDLPVHTKLRDLIGPDLIGTLFDRLDAQLRVSLGQNLGLDALALEAHAIVSSAGMLGFTDLSRRCQRLEEALRAGGRSDEVLASAREGIAAVLAHIETRRMQRAAA